MNAKKHVHFLLTFFIAVGTLCGCASGRQPILAGEIPPAKPPSEADEQFGHELLGQLTQQYPLETRDEPVDRVRHVVDRLTQAINANQDPWHVYVFQSDEVVNAAATRGNHLFVWSGMLKVAKTEPELATVLAHELGHILASHTMPTPGEMTNAAIGSVTSGVTGQVLRSHSGTAAWAGLAEVLIDQLYKATVINPQSKRLELEADTIGLFLMAKAGYDPRLALEFWKKAEGLSEFQGVPLSFLSSHPGSAERVLNIEQNLPKALEVRAGKSIKAVTSEAVAEAALDAGRPPKAAPPKKQLPVKRKRHPMQRSDFDIS
jgi:predicted Zn-dependent protease